MLFGAVARVFRGTAFTRERIQVFRTSSIPVTVDES